MSAFPRWLLKTWYSPYPVWFFIPLAWIFWLISGLRRGAYHLGLLRTATLPVPVVVVGNISVGGTGKTPFVIWLSLELRRQGFKPGIVTRGYRADAGHARLVSATGSAEEAGDEALLLARHGGAPVAAGHDRAAAAQLLLASGIDVILSDDGLQHYQLPRIHEIVLVDGARGLGNGWLLPAGPLRESEHRLDSVQQVVVKETPGGAFTWPDAARMRLTADTAVSLREDGTRVPLASFSGRKVHAVAGIGDPRQFFATLEAAGLKVDGRPLPDHARFETADLAFDDTAPVFMTEKDAVKCAGLGLTNHWYVEAAASFDAADAAHILQGVLNKLEKR